MLRRAALLAFFAAALAPAAGARAERLWTLQLAGGSAVLSLDAPEERGAVLVFHRHPDGVFSSVRTADVRRISIAEGPDPAKRTRAREWEVLVLGRDAEGPDRGPVEPAGPRGPVSAPVSPEGDLGYGAWTWGFPGAPGPPHHRPPGVPPGRVPALARPNGFPAVGPLGSAAPPIGPNGFPILAPPAVPTPVFRP